MTKAEINQLKQKIINGYQISFDEATKLIQTIEKETFYNEANEIRMHFCGDDFDMCSIINAKSGKCSEDCKWCSQSVYHKTNIDIYDIIDKKEAVDLAKSNEVKGVKRFSLVTSGKRVNLKELDKILTIYNEIKCNSNIHLCASMGLLTRQQLQQLKDVGIDHYHCNVETAPSYFPELCSTHTMDDKIETIKYAQEIGLKVCSGGIIGMGESAEQRIEMAFLLKDLKIKSIPINVLNPIEGTKLENAKYITNEEVLDTIAIFRFINPDAKIRFAGGRLQIKAIEEKALQSGINAALVGDLLTTLGSNVDTDKKTFTRAGFKL